jgi:uncharacterized repeat protein (TIGR01451 family)
MNWRCRPVAHGALVLAVALAGLLPATALAGHEGRETPVVPEHGNPWWWCAGWKWCPVVIVPPVVKPPPVETPPVVKPPPVEIPPVVKPPPVVKSPPVETPPGVSPPVVTPPVVTPPVVTVAATPPPPAVPAAVPPTTTLRVAKDGPARVQAGGVALYRIRVTNGGAADASDVRVVELLPGGFSVVAAQSPGVRLVSGRPTWSVGALRAGGSRTLTIRLRAGRDLEGRRCNRVIASAGNAPAARASACLHVTAVPERRSQPAVTG